MVEVYGVGHLFMTGFLYWFANAMVAPAITDVTVAALCPGKDECSLAIYLTGAQNVIIGLGSVVMMPMIGKLSDTYGRKIMLTLPMTLTVFPLVILGYSRGKYYFYSYYVLKTLFAMATEGSVQFLAFAYVADNVEESKRNSVFGILLGFLSSGFVLANVSSRFLSTSATFQVAAAMSIIALLYMRVFLPESIMKNNIVSTKGVETDCLLEKAQSKKLIEFFKTPPLLDDIIGLFKSGSTFFKVAIIAFLSIVADIGLYSSLLYILKVQFHFNKDQFADLRIISGISASISELILIPILTPLVGEEKLLSIGLFFSCVQMLLYSFAWSSWVPYAAAMISAMAIFTSPCLRSIVSKQTRPNEQGKGQGYITSICSLANIVSPFAFSPLTALFLSDNAPFHLPGFSILLASFAIMIAFAQSLAIWPRSPSPSTDTFV